MLPPLDHDEARRELTGLLDGSIGAVPLAPLVEHLMSIYAAAGWPVLRDAGLALRRRAASVEHEQLEVAERPKGAPPPRASPALAALQRSLRWRAKRALGLGSVGEAEIGAVTFVQRCDSSLRLDVHFHSAPGQALAERSRGCS